MQHCPKCSQTPPTVDSHFDLQRPPNVEKEEQENLIGEDCNETQDADPDCLPKAVTKGVQECNSGYGQEELRNPDSIRFPFHGSPKQRVKGCRRLGKVAVESWL